MNHQEVSMAKSQKKRTIATTPEELRSMISEAAYYLAEQRGFEGDCSLHDWLEAEEKIERI